MMQQSKERLHTDLVALAALVRQMGSCPMTTEERNLVTLVEFSLANAQSLAYRLLLAPSG